MTPEGLVAAVLPIVLALREPGLLRRIRRVLSTPWTRRDGIAFSLDRAPSQPAPTMARRHNTAILAVMLLVIGTALLGGGVGDLPT